MKEHAQQDKLVLAVETAEQNAHHLGLFATARALNRAKKVLGWELSGNVVKAAKVADGA